MRFSEIEQKEVINTYDGCKLGFVYDIDIDEKTGQVKKFIISKKCKVLGVFGKEQEYHIKWCDVKCIGDDLILIYANTRDILVEF